MTLRSWGKYAVRNCPRLSIARKVPFDTPEATVEDGPRRHRFGTSQRARVEVVVGERLRFLGMHGRVL